VLYLVTLMEKRAETLSKRSGSRSHTGRGDGRDRGGSTTAQWDRFWHASAKKLHHSHGHPFSRASLSYTHLIAVGDRGAREAAHWQPAGVKACLDVRLSGHNLPHPLRPKRPANQIGPSLIRPRRQHALSWGYC
jgi:hypothetical protein